MRRGYATRRGAVAGKGFESLKPEMQADGCSPADLLYQNPIAFKNRLELFHLFRLRQQEKLDRYAIKEMRQEWTHSDNRIVTITTKFKSGEPGTKVQQSNDDSHIVQLHVKVYRLQLDDSARHKLLLLIGHERYDPDSDTMTLESSQFPLKELNKRRVIEMFKKLLNEARNVENNFDDVPLDGKMTIKKRTMRKALLAFPKSWLEQAQQIKAKEVLGTQSISSTLAK